MCSIDAGALDAWTDPCQPVDLHASVKKASGGDPSHEHLTNTVVFLVGVGFHASVIKCVDHDSFVAG